MTDHLFHLSRPAAAATLTDPQWRNAPTERDPGYFRVWQRVSLALQRSLPSASWDKEGTGDAPPAAPLAPPPPRTPGVVEWAGRAGLFARMVSRAYPSANAAPDVAQALATLWDLAAKASGLEGEVASHTRKLEALERRGRALRAEIGRKVEELAHEESRVLREAAAYGEEEEAARRELGRAEQIAPHLDTDAVLADLGLVCREVTADEWRAAMGGAVRARSREQVARSVETTLGAKRDDLPAHGA